jgi:hypothetical protein
MATVGTLKTRVLYDLSDISQHNYVDAEIWIQFNKGLNFVSKELSKFDSKVGVTDTTLTIAASGNSTSLNAAFLNFAVNEKSEPKVFNVTAGYPRMTQAKESDIDYWEQQTSVDTGTPSEFYLRGLTFYVHPWALIETTIKYYYHPIKTIVNDASTMPWDGLFDEAIAQFVVMALRMRDERLNMTQLDSFLFDVLKKDVMDILFKREGFTMNMAPGAGWND